MARMRALQSKIGVALLPLGTAVEMQLAAR
jgi:hypothetical protein